MSARADCRPVRTESVTHVSGINRYLCNRYRPAQSGGDAGIRTLDTGFGPYAPLAGECLRPLGHLSDLDRVTNTRFYLSRIGSVKANAKQNALPAASRSLRRLVELERTVELPHRKLEVFLIDDDGGLDLRGRDHLDVDTLVGERLEHPRRDADMRAHADADQRY